MNARVLAALALGLGVGAGLARRRVERRAATEIALITGGSRGLGLLLAREYLRRGARVAICARDAEELERAKTSLAGDGQPVLAVPCDVTEPAEVAQAVAMVRQHLGPVDTLVNNAGLIQVGPTAHMTALDYERAFAVHFWAPFWTTGAVLPDMLERKHGRLVNIASLAGLMPVPHMLPYVVSKSALVGWSEGLRLDLARAGISVTTVCPGLIRTGSPRHAEFKGRHREEYTWFSIGDSLPVLAMNAERAARRIVRAGERGAARVVLPLAARLPVVTHALFPGMVLGALSAVEGWLPGTGGVGAASHKGRESVTRLSPSWLTALGDEAARRNNEL
jgi:NAD(P)-dependent dehydrogenase (short-subunit alcohol dehydrogenase family)